MDILEVLQDNHKETQKTISNWRKPVITNRRRTVQSLIEVLYESGRFSDVTFLVGQDKEPVKAHRLILITRSSVFEAMFSSSWSSKGSGEIAVVEVPDAEPESFRWFLKFLYTDNTEGFVSPVDILYLGQKYDVKELVGNCAEYLAATIQLTTVVEIYQAAKLFDLLDLQASTMKFMLKNGESLLAQEDFCKLSIETVSELLANDALSVSEVTVFRGVVMWATVECERQGLRPTDTNLRTVADSLFKLIRFPTMSPQAFSNDIVPLNILTSDEIIKIFVYFTSHELTACRNPEICSPFIVKPRDCHKDVNHSQNFLNENFSVGVYLSSTSCSPIGQVYTVTGNAGKLHEESLDFIVDRDIAVVGVGFYGPAPERLRNCNVKTYMVDIQVFNYQSQVGSGDEQLKRTLVSRTRHTVCTRTDYQVDFIHPISMKNGKIHHFRIAFKGQETRHGVTRLSNVSTVCNRDENVTFNFLGPAPIASSQYPGRIRSLIFRPI